MTIILPSLDKNGSIEEWKPIKNEDYMIYKYRSGQTSDMICLKNKLPTWNSVLGAYVLNFLGRITVPSVKNFQLVSKDDGSLYNNL